MHRLLARSGLRVLAHIAIVALLAASSVFAQDVSSEKADTLPKASTEAPSEISVQTPVMGPVVEPGARTEAAGKEGAPAVAPEDTAAAAVATGAATRAAPVTHQATPPATNSGSSAADVGLSKLAGAETAQALRIVLGLTVLAILPALLVCVTSFLRTIIVLSMLRHAIGMPETPPNPALIGLALFLTAFTMSPVLQQVNEQAFKPFMDGKIGMEAAYEKGVDPLRQFMVRQTREQDLALMVELSKAPVPSTIADISNVQLVPAFMLSELRAAFQIGFVIFLPFLLIDLIVSSILMALGMMMMPPTTIALPLKILMFVLIDGWSLVLKALVGSFH